MRFMILVKATRDSEAGVMPSQELLAERQIRRVMRRVEVRPPGAAGR